MTPTLLPAKDESLDGFLRRFAEAELWTDVADLLRTTGLEYGRPMIEQSNLLESHLGLPAGTLDECLPSAAAPKPVLNWRFERLHSAPVCPVCIANGLPYQQAWRHCFVTACPDHSVMLIDECPICCEYFQPGRGGYGSCHCGCPLERLPHKEAELSDIALSALISGKMNPSRALLAPALAFLTPHDIGAFVFFLAAGETQSKTDKPGKTPLPGILKESRQFLRPAMAMLCDWPDAFSQNVEHRLTANRGSSAPARLGKWYQRLMRFDGPGYDDFRAILTDVVSREFDGIYAGTAASAPYDRAWVSAAVAAKELGIRPDRVVEAVADNKIPGRMFLSGFGHRHTTIHREVIERISTDRANYMDKSQVRKFLGISRKQYDLLLASGFLAAILPAEVPPLVDGTHDAQGLRATITTIADAGQSYYGETIAFSQINLRFTTDTRGIYNVFLRIADGTIPAQTCSTTGKLCDFRFLRSDIDRVLSDVRRCSGMTTQEVAKLAGWKEQCVGKWCDAGLIHHSTYSIAGRTGRVIQPQSLIEFQRKFIPVADLAKQLNTSSRGLLSKLAKAGIEPIGSFQDGRAWRGHVVSLSDVAAACLMEDMVNN